MMKLSKTICNEFLMLDWLDERVERKPSGFYLWSPISLTADGHGISWWRQCSHLPATCGFTTTLEILAQLLQHSPVVRVDESGGKTTQLDTNRNLVRISISFEN